MRYCGPRLVSQVVIPVDERDARVPRRGQSLALFVFQHSQFFPDGDFGSLHVTRLRGRYRVTGEVAPTPASLAAAGHQRRSADRDEVRREGRRWSGGSQPGERATRVRREGAGGGTTRVAMALLYRPRRRTGRSAGRRCGLGDAHFATRAVDGWGGVGWHHSDEA